MSREISEADWKLFRALHPVALERFCAGVLSEIAQFTSGTGKSAHERYVATYRLLERRDKELVEAFNDRRRSTALLQLAVIRGRGFEEEFAQFSPETRDAVQVWMGGEPR